MPNRSKQKGDRAERAIVELLRSHGLDAYRIPLSGAVSGFKSDVELRLGNQKLKLESKVKEKGFNSLYKWLSDADICVIKADRKPALAVIPLNLLASLAHQTIAKSIEKATHKTSNQPLPNTASINPPPVTKYKPLGRYIEWLQSDKVSPVAMTSSGDDLD